MRNTLSGTNFYKGHIVFDAISKEQFGNLQLIGQMIEKNI